MNKIWIVGYGYLGEAIADEFLSHDWEIVRIGRSEAEGVDVADVTDADSLRKLAQKNGFPDVVVHCASSGRGGEEAYRAVFKQGAENLVEVFPDARILFTSSTSVYPQVDGENVTESSEANPDRATGKILRQAEEIILAAGGCVLRLSGIYGEGRSVILKKWLKGELKVEEDGRRILNQIHRRDAANAFWTVVKADVSGEIINVSEVLSKSQLATIQWLAEHYEREMPESVPRDLNRKRGWTHKLVISRKLVGLGWAPRYVTFTDAVEDIEPTIDLS